MQFAEKKKNSQHEVSWLDKFTLPCLEADQCILYSSLMVFSHILMHIWVVLPDVAFSAAVGNRPETKRRRIGVWALELQEEKLLEEKKCQMFKEGDINVEHKREKAGKKEERGKNGGEGESQRGNGDKNIKVKEIHEGGRQ